MQTIKVNHSNGRVTIYSSGSSFRINEEGASEKITRTQDEELQSCYKSLIDEVKRDVFNSLIKHVVTSYLGWDEKDVENIKIEITGKDRKCEMNIGKSIEQIMDELNDKYSNE